MTAAERLGAPGIADVIRTYRDALGAHRAAINRLNVYPVPDGDTGTNMSLTLESVAAELDGAGDLESVCRAISHGSLMGARGNSGVILSQLLRGLADSLARAGGLDVESLADGLHTASEAAYGAVMRPVEGTILTVAASAAAAAREAANAGADLVGALERTRAAAAETLARTPEMLEVLKTAGVVDAGGAGFVLLLDAALSVLDGRPVPEPDESADAAAVTPGAGSAPVGGGDGSKDVSELRYEVMFLLDAADERVPDFREAWGAIGDSIVVVGGDGLWNCHIHTDEIGASIEAGIAAGRPHNIRVTDLFEEADHVEDIGVPGAAADDAGGEGLFVGHHEATTTAVVAVGAGDGVRRIFESLGVQAVVVGGQTMNPSTEMLVRAADAVSAAEVVVLPNNKNIVPVANQVDGFTERIVRVVETRSIAEGFAALLAFDPEADAETNREAMAAAADAVVSGDVTRAVRDATSPVGPISEGDHIGLDRSGVRVVATDLVGATTALLDRIVGEDHEILTLIEGADADEAATAEITAWLAANRPGLDVEVHHGGQPLYPYHVGVE